TTRDHTRQRLHVTSEVRLLAERLDRRVVGVVPKPDGVIAIDDPQADDVRALIDSTARSWVWHQEAVLAGSTAQERAGPRPRTRGRGASPPAGGRAEPKRPRPRPPPQARSRTAAPRRSRRQAGVAPGRRRARRPRRPRERE